MGPCTYQHGNGHDAGAKGEGDFSAHFVDNDHFQNGTADLEGALDAASEQGQAGAQAQDLEEGGQVVLHGRGATHLGHELQKGGAPHAGKQTRVRKEREPVETRLLEVHHRLPDVVELFVDLILIEQAVTEKLQRFPAFGLLSALDEPTWSICARSANRRLTPPAGTDLRFGQEWDAGHEQRGRDEGHGQREAPANIDTVRVGPERDAVPYPGGEVS
jgi:hypothetical protein